MNLYLKPENELNFVTEKYENIFKSAKDQKIGPKSQMSYYLYKTSYK